MLNMNFQKRMFVIVSGTGIVFLDKSKYSFVCLLAELKQDVFGNAWRGSIWPDIGRQLSCQEPFHENGSHWKLNFHPWLSYIFYCFLRLFTLRLNRLYIFGQCPTHILNELYIYYIFMLLAMILSSPGLPFFSVFRILWCFKTFFVKRTFCT